MRTVSIPLTKGKVAVIDADDLPLVQGYCWQAQSAHTRSGWYAVTNWRERTDGGVLISRSTPMHALILGTKPGLEIDHIDRDGLNNTRANLRHATHAQNKANCAPYRTNTSGYKGVSRHKRRWRALISYGGRPHYIGLYATAEEAARAYDAKAREVFDEFAGCNFPDL
jgi:hypothetical protein